MAALHALYYTPDESSIIQAEPIRQFSMGVNGKLANPL